MTMPNFLIVGASKGGTSTLHYVLDQHPEIYMCPVKEIGFFWSYGEEVRLFGPGKEKLQNRLVNDLEKYQSFFSHATTEKAIGESSVRYLSNPRAPKIIHQFIPRAKLIASLRQPADRAFSSFMHNVRDGVEPCKDFSEAVYQERQGLRDQWTFCKYLSRGFYYAALVRFLEYFDRQQMHISLFDDLKENPGELIRGLLQFFEVDDHFTVDLSHRHNVSGIIRNPGLRLMWTRSNKMRASLRPLFSAKFKHTVSEWFFRDMEKPEMSSELRAELTKYFREDIEQLQDLLQRDLSHWFVPV